jgi:hypothetical protein
MESSQKAAEHFLDHSDAQLRQAAIQALVRTWQVTSSLGERFEHMLANDSELIVRCEAAHALAWCYRHTDDRRVGKLSANLVHDETVPEKLRRAAYRGLFIVREVSRDVLRRLLFEKRDMFDSEFVESFRKADEPSSEKGGSHDDA